MKIYAALVVLTGLALLPSGCATPLAPERCAEAAARLSTAAQIAQVLIDRGIAPAKARKLADAVVAGRMLLAAACAQAAAEALGWKERSPH